MQRSKSNTARRQVLALTIAELILAGHALAQEPGAARAMQIEQVTVTARRVEESLQDVPTAVTALTSNDLEALKIDGFLTVGQTVPNVYIQKQGGSPAAPQMNIRGVSNGSLNLQVDSGIGMYIDGVYMGRAGAAAFEMADLERVEVMRGPQGTLFGRNSTGGAINLITAKPTGELGLRVDGGFGNYEDKHYKALLDLPEWHGLSSRVVLGHSEYEGDVENLSTKRTVTFPAPFGTQTTNDRGGDSDTDNAFVALRFTGIEHLQLDYKFDYTDWEGTMNYRQMGSIGACVDFDSTPGQCITQTGSPLVTPVHPWTLDFAYHDKLAEPLESTATNEVKGHSFTATYELSDNLNAKYIYGHREYDLDAGTNQVFGASEYIDTGLLGNPGGVYTPLLAFRVESQEQDSHELQLIGNWEHIEGILGGFWFNEKGSVNGPILLSSSIADGDVVSISAAAFHYFVGQNDKVENESQAFYGHLTWHVGQVDLSGGARYTEDDRKEFVIAAGLYGAILPGDQHFDYSGDHTDYDASLTWNFSDSANVYFKYATGFVSGGTLFGNKFDQDEMKLYEVGLKSELLDRSLRLNAALFRQERNDVQIEGFTSIGYFMGKGDEINSDGVELEATWIPLEGLTVNTTWGYTDVSSSGDLRTYQPENTAYFGLQYDFPSFAGGIEPMARIDLSWRDKVHRLACPAGQDQIPASDVCVGTPDPALDDAAYINDVKLLSARVEFAEIPLGGDTRGKVTLWGRNLLDEDEIEFNFTLGGPTITNTFVRPRTYGVDFSVRF